jgi:hypothetical protein
MTNVSDPIELLSLANPVPAGSLRAVAAEQADGLLAALRAGQAELCPHAGRGFLQRRAPFARRSILLATALAVIASLSVAWAAGAWTPEAPLTLFESNPQGTAQQATPGAGPGWNQTVIPDSVKQVASVEIPKVGPVEFWHADAEQGGWCAGLRLSNGAWLGTGESPLDGGGIVPGCFPKASPEPASNGLNWEENDIDAHSVGGDDWRIRYGLIDAPGAVKVTDLTTGKSTNVIDGDLFILPIEAQIPSMPPYTSPRFHLVAYDKAGNVIASDCRSCSDG